jgi:hypothetical protein
MLRRAHVNLASSSRRLSVIKRRQPVSSQPPHAACRTLSSRALYVACSIAWMPRNAAISARQPFLRALAEDDAMLHAVAPSVSTGIIRIILSSSRKIMQFCSKPAP